MKAFILCLLLSFLSGFLITQVLLHCLVYPIIKTAVDVEFDRQLNRLMHESVISEQEKS